VGWANEFETIRIRLTDFATGTGIDLSDIRLVGFVFRDQSGHISARLGFDDLELTVE
jgi:hypothetical protein